MLYKTWESQAFPYTLSTQYPYAPVETIMTEGAWGTWYGIWTTNRPEEFTMQDGTPTSSLSQIYSFTTATIDGWPRSRIDKWDGATGELIWTHYRPYDLISLRWVSREKIFNDDENRVWSHDIFGFSGGHLYRHPEFTDPNAVLAYSIGMPDFDHSDYTLNDGEWLNEDGTGFAFDFILGPVVNTLGLSHRGDWAAMTYWGDDGTNLAIHNISDRQRRGYVKLLSTAARGLAVDAATLYIFTERLTVEIIDVPRLQHLGELQFGDYAMPSLFQGKLGLGFDRTYRRMITMMPSPDDPVTGLCTIRLEGWALREAAEVLTKPIVLKTPREGRSVPVLGRIYGWTGKGVSGEQVTASLLSGDGTISPTRVAADPNGFVRYIWTPATPDDATSTIQLQADVEQSLPGLTVVTATPKIYYAPEQIRLADKRELFYPGYWLKHYIVNNSGESDVSCDDIFGPYLDQYDEEDEERENRWRGIYMEYTWEFLDGGDSGYNFQRVIEHIGWARARGMKFMMGIRHYRAAGAPSFSWTPSYIKEGSEEDYGPYYPGTYLRGIFSVTPGGGSALEMALPDILNSAVRDRLKALLSAILTYFGSDKDFVGICPFDYTPTDSTAWSRAGRPLSAWYEAKRDVLSHLDGSYLLVGDWVSTEILGSWEINSAHASWCAQKGISLYSGQYVLKDDFNMSHKAAALLSQWAGQTTTGIMTGRSFTTNAAYNTTCLGSLATFREWLFGGPSLVDQDSGCSRVPVDQYMPWQVLVQPSSGIWDYPTGSGVMDTMDQKALAREQGYYGIVPDIAAPIEEEEDIPPPGGGTVLGQTADGTWYTLEQELAGEVTETLFIPNNTDYDTVVCSSPSTDKETHWGCGPDSDPGVAWVTETCPINATLRSDLCYVLRLRIDDGNLRSTSINFQSGPAGDRLYSWIFALSRDPYKIDRLAPNSDYNCINLTPRDTATFDTNNCGVLSSAVGVPGVQMLYAKWEAANPSAAASVCIGTADARCRMYVKAW